LRVPRKAPWAPHDMRAAMDSILYLLRTACRWRHLPRDSFPPRSTRTAAEGLASRPIRSRNVICSSTRSLSDASALNLARPEPCERCCRPWSAAESCRGADGATGRRCAANREWSPSPRACRSCAVSHPATPRGPAAPASPTPRPSDTVATHKSVGVLRSHRCSASRRVL